MTPDSPAGQAGRLARIEGQLEWVVATVRALGNMPIEVSRNTDRIEALQHRVAKFEEETGRDFEKVHTEVRELDQRFTLRAEERRKQEAIDARQLAIDKRTDFKWKVGTLISLLAILVTLAFGVVSLAI